MADFVLNTVQFNSFELRQFLWFVNSSHKLIHNNGDLTQMTLKDNQQGSAVENSFARTLLYFSQMRKQSLVNEPSDWNEMRLSLFFTRFPSLNTLRDSIHVKNQRRWPGVFTWENAHQREFHAGMSSWFIIAFIHLQVFPSSHVYRDDVILDWRELRMHYPLQSSTGMKFYVRHSNCMGWTRAGTTVSGSIM